MFKKVNSKEPLPHVEERILKYLEKNKIFEKSVEQRKKAEKYVGLAEKLVDDYKPKSSLGGGCGPSGCEGCSGCH